MGIIKSTVRVGEKPPKEVIKRLKAAARQPINYTAEAPRATPEVLKEFAQLAVERNRQKKKQTITIRITPDVLESYKTMGSGYTGIMSDVLQYAINNPSVLAAATK
ncbi:MAG: BrnA antitoxin family protein [Treponema sp.]|nr:BrnA antitoxin family protein [Treponema sp.]